MAREIREVSQRDLAGHLGLTPAAVSQYENGRATPSQQTLASIARYLDFDQAFFGLPPASEVETPAFFRSLRRAPAARRRRARHLIELAHEIVMVLEREVRLPKVDVPRHPLPPDARTPEVEAAAGTIRTQWNLGRDPINDLVREIERHGVVVLRTMVGDELDAFSVRYRSRPLMVLTSDKAKRDRSRFDAAHELGHLVLHDPSLRATQLVEKQAHQFAAALLMPAESIRPELPRTFDIPAYMDLKRRWQCSMAALLMRAKTLGVMKPDVYTAAMKQMSARGWRRHEPADLGHPEQPVLLQRAMEAADLTPADIEKRTQIPQPLLAELLHEGDDRPSLVI